MKKTIIVLMLLAGLISKVYAEERILVLGSLEWPPYATAALADQGSANGKLKATMQKLGVRVEYKFMPWARVLKEMKDGTIEGLFPAWPEEISPLVLKSDPVAWSEVGLIKKSSNDKVKFISVEDAFTKYTFGIVRDYGYPTEMIGRLRASDLIKGEPNDDKQLALMLNQNRFDISLTDPAVAKFYSESLKLDPVETLAVIYKKELVLGLSDTPKNKELMELLNKTLQMEGK